MEEGYGGCTRKERAHCERNVSNKNITKDKRLNNMVDNVSYRVGTEAKICSQLKVLSEPIEAMQRSMKIFDISDSM